MTEERHNTPGIVNFDGEVVHLFSSVLTYILISKAPRHLMLLLSSLVET